MASVAEDNIVQVWQMCENIYLQEDDLPDVSSATAARFALLTADGAPAHPPAAGCRPRAGRRCGVDRLLAPFKLTVVLTISLNRYQ
jgi:hypothetical protein